MPSQVTVTGKIGPGATLTSAVFTDVVSFSVNPTKRILTITKSDESIISVDINAATVMTVTIAASGFTIVVS